MRMTSDGLQALNSQIDSSVFQFQGNRYNQRNQIQNARNE